MVVKPKPLVKRKIRNDNEAVKNLEVEIDKFLEANFDGTGEVGFDITGNVSKEAIDRIVRMYTPHWDFYHWTGTQRDECNRLIFNYGRKK